MQPPNLLGMDPESYTVVTRWTAPSAGLWSITGLFQGIDTSEHAHPVEILENGSTVILSPTTISSFGQVVNFSSTVNLSQGATIDFIVSVGSTFTDLSTGLEATIQGASVVPEPSSLMLGSLALVSVGLFACARHRLRCRAA